MSDTHADPAPDIRDIWLLGATFVVAVAGLVYELIAGAVSSYLLGDSVTQFSLVIGIFMTSMGLGAWLSRYVQRAERGFTLSQILLGIIGGFSAPVLFLSYGWLGQVQGLLFLVVIGIGTLSGLEIPLITRILQARGALPHTLSNVLTADYVGALVAAILFPLLVVPQLGLMAASLVFGVLNLAVAALSLWLFRERIGLALPFLWAVGLTACLAALIWSDRLVSLADTALHEDDVIFAEDTPYQRITITRFRDRTRLFLNGSIQFDSFDEYRYHEALVHPAMAHVAGARNVLILGGGDGMAAREVLRWDNVQAVSLVDLDPRVTEIFRNVPHLAELNDFALSDDRLEIVNTDAWKFVESADDIFDVIIIDLPDPKNFAVSKLYSREFYARLVERLSARGVIVTQAGSPVFATQAFWSIHETLAQTRNPIAPGDGLLTRPYHAYVPSFGDWGFVLASFGQLPAQTTLPPGLRFYDTGIWDRLTQFPADTGPVDVEPNSIMSHPLVAYYRHGWEAWYE